MSIFTNAFSPPNTSLAITLANSVLPTPVGPINRKEPIGRRVSVIPLRPRRIALATAATASSCPMIDFFSSSSRFISIFISDPCTLLTGIPVFSDTAVAKFSSVRVGFSIFFTPAFSNFLISCSSFASSVFRFAAFS